MLQPAHHPPSGFFGALHPFLSRRPRPANSRTPEKQARFQPRLEALEDRTLLAVQLLSHYNGLDYYTSGGWVPPDTVGAAGPTSYIETVNATVAIYTPKDIGTSVVTDSLFHFFWVTGGLPQASPTSGFVDASMV